VRPPELSDDHTGTIPVIAHAINWMKQNIGHIEFACCIYPTAPFVQSADLQRGLHTLQTSGAQYAFSVTTYAFPIQRAIRITPENRVAMFQPEHFNSRSQDLEEAMHDAGQFYWGVASAWLSEKPLFGEHAAPVTLPRFRVQDIDTPEDWQSAEWLFKAMQYAEGQP
jgi:N-acylneuraminate cytidylyltransferase